jgi:hypothetical protein
MIYLNRNYLGYLAGTIVQLTTTAEAALIAQGLAVSSVGPVTPGNVNCGIASSGRVGIAAAGTSVTVTGSNLNTESKFLTFLSNASADGTAVSITRIVPAAGSVTFFLNAAATTAVSIDWSVVNAAGLLAATT